MLFELQILDPEKILILRDVFTLPNITVMMEVSVGIMERFDLNQKLPDGFELLISSSHGKHIDYHFQNVRDASYFKDAIYDYLIRQETAPT